MSAFEIYLRTGRRLAFHPEAVETKFNPWHDSEDGRFTFAGQGNYFGRESGAQVGAAAKRDSRIEGIPGPIRSHPNYGEMRLVMEAHGRTPLKAPDGAFYVLPKGVDEVYIQRAIRHLGSVDLHVARLSEFKRMYTDSAHPYFLDFKRFGTPSGPRGYPAIAPIEYFSIAAGKAVRSSPFEASGNLFYGFIGSSVGFTNDELIAAAWLVQEGRSGPYDKYIRNFLQDSPQDTPHVRLGIRLAAKFSLEAVPVIAISPPPVRHPAK